MLITVPVPAGEHEVLLEYRPSRDAQGMACLALSIGLALAASIALPRAARAAAVAR